MSNPALFSSLTLLSAFHFTAPLPHDIVCLGIGASIDNVLMSEVVWLLTVRDAIKVIIKSYFQFIPLSHDVVC
jgi:hypothetical protein